VEFIECVEAPIRPLIEKLGFIENKQRWAFRFGAGYLRSNKRILGLSPEQWA